MRKEPPPYGRRKGWVPRSLEDYGDGGAFPEIHVAQFPLNMGKKKSAVSVSEIRLAFPPLRVIFIKSIHNLHVFTCMLKND